MKNKLNDLRYHFHAWAYIKSTKAVWWLERKLEKVFGDKLNW